MTGVALYKMHFILCSETCGALGIPPEARKRLSRSLQIAVSPVDNLLSPFSISNFASLNRLGDVRIREILDRMVEYFDDGIEELFILNLVKNIRSPVIVFRVMDPSIMFEKIES